MTPLEIAEAWHSVQDEWFVRCNDMNSRKPWEVVHQVGNIISEETTKVVSRHISRAGAEAKAERLEDAARGAAVLAALTSG